MKKFLNAVSFMTIIPLPGYKYADLSEAGKSSAYFPVVGMVLGLILWAAARLSVLIWPLPVTAVITTAVWVLLTAGLHVDGLADLSDGLGGGWDVESRLKIMKDSAIGTYGALAIIILFMTKAVLLYALADTGTEKGFPLLYSALILVPAAARCAQVLSIKMFEPAKKEGFGIVFKNGVRTRDVIAAILFCLTALTAFWGWHGVVIFAASILFMLVCGKWISARLGGLNGDSYGAVCELSELFLLLLVSIVKPQFTGWLQLISARL